MSELAVAAALVLAGVFAAAGVAKGRRAAYTTATFRALRLPAPAALARAVPAAELVLAVMLVLAPSAGGIAALVLLAGFSLVLARALRRGEQVACGCFGTAGTQPVGPADLIRNGLLALLALAAVTAPALGPSVPSLPALLAVTTAAMIGLVVLALVRVRLATGALLDTSGATIAGGDR